jgi:hypothetical protein
VRDWQVLGCSAQDNVARRICTMFTQIAQVGEDHALSAMRLYSGRPVRSAPGQNYQIHVAVLMQVLVFLVAPLLARHRLEMKARQRFEAADQAMAAQLDATGAQQLASR